MLHMKHRDVLMNDDFKPIRWNAVGQIEKLVTIQIVGCGHSFRSAFSQPLRGEMIRYIQ